MLAVHVVVAAVALALLAGAARLAVGGHQVALVGVVAVVVPSSPDAGVAAVCGVVCGGFAADPAINRRGALPPAHRAVQRASVL